MKLIIEVTEDYYAWLKDKADNNKASVSDITILDGLPYEDRPQGEWIPIKTRPMTDEEIKDFEESWGEVNPEDVYMFDCSMPEDGQEILISTKLGVCSDTCCRDYGIGLEGRGDWDGVLAWMPFPEPYKEVENE